jgi:predicted nuclease with TOPRIM domain
MAVSATLQRLTAVEREIKGLRGDMQVLRQDLNDGLGKLLAALDRLTGKIDEVAAVRPQLADLERRVTRLEEARP